MPIEVSGLGLAPVQDHAALVAIDEHCGKPPPLNDLLTRLLADGRLEGHTAASITTVTRRAEC